VKTKHCRVCDVVLTTKNKYRPRSRTKGNGSICYPCHLAINRARYKSRMKNKTVYIEEKHYPRTRVVQELSEHSYKAESFSHHAMVADQPEKAFLVKLEPE
jgi:hypothetical protein